MHRWDISRPSALQAEIGQGSTGTMLQVFNVLKQHRTCYASAKAADWTLERWFPSMLGNIR
jgi:hypothetical protein